MEEEVFAVSILGLVLVVFAEGDGQGELRWGQGVGDVDEAVVEEKGGVEHLEVGGRGGDGDSMTDLAVPITFLQGVLHHHDLGGCQQVECIGEGSLHLSCDDLPLDDRTSQTGLAGFERF